MKKILTILIVLGLFTACSEQDVENRDLSTATKFKSEYEGHVLGFSTDSLNFEIRPGNIILTKNKAHRLTPIYKVNYYDKSRSNTSFIGSTYAHRLTNSNADDDDNWNDNFMPGFAAVYGYNLINISHHNNINDTENKFFDEYVLIHTLYYPALSKDTLNNEPVTRDYYMVSVYDEDTNKDGFVNDRDLRRFYLFDIEGKKTKTLIPKYYYTMSSEYDPENDLMYVVAREDVNGNGQMEVSEPMDIFWIDLKEPNKVGKQCTTYFE